MTITAFKSDYLNIKTITQHNHHQDKESQRAVQLNNSDEESPSQVGGT